MSDSIFVHPLMFAPLLMSILLFFCPWQVELTRHFNFRYAKKPLPDDVIPIISANMDTIGTFGMAVALAEVWLSTIEGESHSKINL